MSPINIPYNISLHKEAHEKWLKMLNDAQTLIAEDRELQAKSGKGFRIRERPSPLEVMGRVYAEYCCLLNQFYEAYLNNMQIQKADYLKDIINVFLSRIYELRNEIVHFVVNDYVYIDQALIQSKLTPDQVEIIIPYHIPLECRSETSERLLQKMWTESIKRRNSPPKKEKPQKEVPNDLFQSSNQEIPSPQDSESSSHDDMESESLSVHTIIPEDFIQVSIIQRHERFRQFFVLDAKAKCIRRRTYFGKDLPEARIELRNAAATLIQRTYRDFMRMKRKNVRDAQRDMSLGLIPNPWKNTLEYQEENNKMYERRRQTRQKINEIFLKAIEKEKIRLLVFKKENQIEDITEEVREWFKEWYYGYGFFPGFPYELEGGTMLVVRGDYPTIEEQIEADEKYLAATKGKTKDMLKQEKKQAKLDQQMKAELEKEEAKKNAEMLLKMRCNPYSDPGYEFKQSAVTQSVSEALHKYQAAWSSYDRLPLDKFAEVIYGYMQEVMTEDLMKELHAECRVYVDELMRLDLKLLIKMQQIMFKRIGDKYPKMTPRKKPKITPMPKSLVIDSALLKGFEPLFDLDIISKPVTKLKDVQGDSTYAAYDYNILDPNASFPPPGYGDIRNRLMLSCAYGIGISPGAVRRKAVLLLGPARNGKSFLVDAVCGEINAVKIDISPEVFTAKVESPGKLLAKVFQVAKVFKPTVIFLKNIERVFANKVPPEDKKLNAKKMKSLLPKLIKGISNDDSVIFIATCSSPKAAPQKPLQALFNEVLLVPVLDYASAQQYLYNAFQSIRSMPRDYNVYALARILQGYGFGVVIELFHRIMNPERIIRLNVKALSPYEFLEPLIDDGLEPITPEEYEPYVQFFLSSCSLLKEREEYAIINAYRDVVYRKEAEKKEKKEKKAANA